MSTQANRGEKRNMPDSKRLHDVLHRYPAKVYFAIGAGLLAIIATGYAILSLGEGSAEIAIVIALAVVVGFIATALATILIRAMRERATGASIKQTTPMLPRGKSETSATPEGHFISFLLTTTSLRIGLSSTVSFRSNAAVVAAFRQLNEARRAQELLPHYDAVRYLPLSNPAFEPDGIVSWSVAAIDFSLIAALSDPQAPEEGRVSASEILKANAVPKNEMLSQPFKRIGILGIQVCLVTSDQRVLLRRRGENVLFARDKWDVSASGFCGSGHIVDGGLLDPSLTVEYEIAMEIGQLMGDPRRIRMLGVFTNSTTGAVDVLAVWQLDSTTEDLMAALAIKKVSENSVFDTEIRALERYVWDSRNLIVPFRASVLRTAFRSCDIYGTDFEPQSLVCLTRALEYVSGEQLDLLDMTHRA